MTYDAAGNRLSLSATVNSYTSYSGSTTYGYDYKDELTSESSTRNAGYSNAFAYDVAGNFTTLRGVGVPTASSDNQLTASGYSYDGDGNPTTYAGNTLTFDPESRLTSFVASGATKMQAGYGYDGLRAWRTDASGATTYYVYNDGDPVVELSSTGALVAVNTFGDNGLLSRYSGSAERYYTFDPQGSTTAAYDSSGSVLYSCLEDAFGYSVAYGSTAGDPYSGFGAQWGYIHEGGMGLYLLMNRFYDPTNGIFLNRDPISYDGGTNIYQYCGDDPATKVDSSGLATYLCYRPVINGCSGKDVGHWFLETGCGSFGYGPHGVIVGNLSNLGDFGVGDVTCILLSTTSAQENCICNNAKAAKNGGTLCGKQWSGKPNYGWGGIGWLYTGNQPNCQDFVNCLLKKCGIPTQHPTFCEGEAL